METLRSIKKRMKADPKLKLVRSGMDEILIDVDGDGMPDAALMDSIGDGYVDTLAVDITGDGEFDLYYHDSDGDGLPDIVRLDPENEGMMPDTGIAPELQEKTIAAANTILTLTSAGEYDGEALYGALQELQGYIEEARASL